MMLSGLDLKLLRDLWKMKSQMLAIVLVIVCGVATFIMFMTNMDSLTRTRDAFYRDYRFADVFATVVRAPESLSESILAIDGVSFVETRITADVKLAIDGFEDPVIGKIMSLPDDGRPVLNALHLRAGRLPDPYRDDEAIVSDAFAGAHGFKPGDRLGAVINGKWKTLTIIGVAVSPEFIYQIRPGAMMPDYKRYGILWMTKSALATAYDMKGAFNDVALNVSPDANTAQIIVLLDALLDRYGGFGAYDRKDQMSHRFLEEEFKQLANFSFIFPMIFIGVAAFLLNVVISRTVSTQRDQVAILKAFGYTNAAIGLHYIKLVGLAVVCGVAGGTAAGAWLGQLLGDLYMQFYRFPYLLYRLDGGIVAVALGVTLAAALVGTLHAIRQAALLPPAEAMRPEPPARYGKSLVERLGAGRLLSQPARMIMRNIDRKPARFLLSVTGVALACATMITSGFFSDAVDFMVKVQFTLSQREDIQVTFIKPTSYSAVYDLNNLHGVLRAEGFRSVPARLSFENRSYRTSIEGIAPNAVLRQILDADIQKIELPPTGIVLTDYLARYLGVGPGDRIRVEVLEGARPERDVVVTGTARQYMGLMGYMDFTALNALMREQDVVSGVSMTVDPLYQKEIYRNLERMPRVAGTVVIENEIRNFYDTMAQSMLFYTFVATLMAGAIIFGVVYNNARIALAERSRELSSLRVLGYTRGEISFIILGELALMTLAAILPGFWIGQMLSAWIARSVASDIFRIPLVIEPFTYALAASVVIASAAISGVIVRRKLDHLNLVDVLKSRE